MVPYNLVVRPLTVLYNKSLRFYYHRNFTRNICKVTCVLLVAAFVITTYKGHSKSSIQWYEKASKSLSEEHLNIAVVEEHHEALKYWFPASHKGLLPQTDNVLIHIDAHLDTGAPAYDHELSRFKFPHTPQQIQMLMQRNDVFIPAAGYQGFISRMVWIYPDWLHPRDMGDRSSVGGRLTLKLGFYDVYINGSVVTGYCVCYEAGEPEDSCDFTDRSGSVIQGFKGECHSYKQIYLYMYSTAMSIERLPKLLTMIDSPSIIIDIDEDFYGVMAGSEALSGIDFKLIIKFNELLADTFTILTVNDESHAHTLLSNILHIIKVTCDHECDRTQFRTIQRFITESGLENIPIGGRRMTSDQLHKLVTFVSSQFNRQKIDQIAQLGFCMRISPQTYKLNVPKDEQIEYETISVCHGVNVPGMHNEIHIPKTSEVDETTDTLDSILQVLPTKDVKLVTVARSNRDGFTPRSLQPKIEEDVLLCLRRKFVDSEIIFDPDLMLHLGQGIGSIT